MHKSHVTLLSMFSMVKSREYINNNELQKLNYYEISEAHSLVAGQLFVEGTGVKIRQIGPPFGS